MVGFFVGGLMERQIVDVDWRYWGFLDFEKSNSVPNKLSDFEEDWLVSGRVLNEVKDVSGETPIVKDFVWDYFDTDGYVKYEHVMRPAHVIGIPLQRFVGKSDVGLVSGLIQDQDMAKDTWKLIQALRKWNKAHPKNQRTLGYSIEGKYLSKSSKGRYAGQVINVAITPNPQDVTTYVEMAKEENNVFAKSLQATPVETDVAKIVDGQAITGTTNDKKVKKYLDFENEEEAYGFFYKLYRSKGKKPVEADKKAKEAVRVYTQWKKS